MQGWFFWEVREFRIGLTHSLRMKLGRASFGADSCFKRRFRQSLAFFWMLRSSLWKNLNCMQMIFALISTA